MIQTENMAVIFDENIPEINLYTAQTPNGIKISIILEELKSGGIQIKQKPVQADDFPVFRTRRTPSTSRRIRKKSRGS